MILGVKPTIMDKGIVMTRMSVLAFTIVTLLSQNLDRRLVESALRVLDCVMISAMMTVAIHNVLKNSIKVKGFVSYISLVSTYVDVLMTVFLKNNECIHL